MKMIFRWEYIELEKDVGRRRSKGRAWDVADSGDYRAERTSKRDSKEEEDDRKLGT